MHTVYLLLNNQNNENCMQTEVNSLCHVNILLRLRP